jgi:tetratricopeptide (TPR) repeat protein
MFLVPKDGMVKAKASAERAIALDPELPEGHVSLGVTETFYEYKWLDAEKEFQRAIELNPFDASVRLWYGWNLVIRGQAQAGIAQAQRAHELDPVSAFVETGLGQMYDVAGQTQTAIQRLRNVVASDPGFANGHRALAEALLHVPNYSEAIHQLQESLRLDPEQMLAIGQLGYAYAKSGDNESARAQLTALQEMKKTRWVAPYSSALVFVGMGDREHAIDSLREAYDGRDDSVIQLKQDPLFADVRGDPRVVAILRGMGLD